ncbi:MAG TPA: hypothetical protein VF103_14225 [Polyangiaceae bacterium]
MTTRSVGVFVFLFAQLLAGAAFARERIAVFVVVAEDPELSQNLTEVTIAKLAEARDVELVGMGELDASLREIPTVQNDGLAACLREPACLADVGARASAGRAVIGSVRREGPNFEVDLVLVHTKTALAEGKTHAEVPADLPRLIEAVQTAAIELIQPTDATPSEPVSAAAGPPAPQNATVPAKALEPVPDERTSKKTAWKTYAGFGAAGLAIVAFSAAVITGSIASEPPSGSTRQQAQEDLERKQNYATAANVSLAVGGVFSAVAIVSFAWP